MVGRVTRSSKTRGDTRMKQDQEILDELVRRILAVTQPIKIILFGSAARGAMGADSDIDVLVVVPVRM